MSTVYTINFVGHMHISVIGDSLREWNNGSYLLKIHFIGNDNLSRKETFQVSWFAAMIPSPLLPCVFLLNLLMSLQTPTNKRMEGGKGIQSTVGCPRLLRAIPECKNG